MYLVSISDFDEGILCELTSLLKPMGFYSWSRAAALSPPTFPFICLCYIFIYLFMLLQAIKALLAPGVLRQEPNKLKQEYESNVV